VQWVQGPHWRAELEKNNVQERVIIPTRGNIYSDNGSLLATSLPKYRLAINPHPDNIPDTMFTAGIDSLAWLLATTFHERSESEYKKLLREGRKERRKFLYLTRQYIEYPDKKKAERWPLLRASRKTSGAIFEKIERRYTPFGELAARTVGYVNENRGVGLEQSYEPMLAGTAGRGIFRRIAGGHWKPLLELSRPHSGFDIETTIDINIQDVAEAALRNALVKHQASYGCVVLMKVETGEIKAMANLGLNRDGSYAENFNYAVARRTEPLPTAELRLIWVSMERNAP
jgi:cell division protein FtsI (penicillin-binding protein 3)